MKGEILSVNISFCKGKGKHPIERGFLIEDWGLEGDIHVGKGSREVSLLAWEDIEEFNQKLRREKLKCPKVSSPGPLGPGDLAENITVRGVDFHQVKIGDLIKIEEVLLEVSQIGKNCHQHCSIYRKWGECIMPKRGIFARVIKGGWIYKGKSVEVIKKDESRDYHYK